MAVMLALGSSYRYRARFLTGHRWVPVCDPGLGDPCSGHAWAVGVKLPCECSLPSNLLAFLLRFCLLIEITFPWLCHLAERVATVLLASLAVRGPLRRAAFGVVLMWRLWPGGLGSPPALPMPCAGCAW